MDKKEFEQKFLEKMKEKCWSSAKRNNHLHQNMKCYLDFIDEHKIYNYVPYESLLSKLDKLHFEEDKNGILAEDGSLAFFDMELDWIVYSSSAPERKDDPLHFFNTIVHELTHALSFCSTTRFDPMSFQKETVTRVISQLPLSIYNKYLNPATSQDQYDELFFDDEEEESIHSEFQELCIDEKDEKILQESKISRPYLIAKQLPVAIDICSGLSRGTIECNNRMSIEKMRKLLPDSQTYFDFHFRDNIPQSLSEFDSISFSDGDMNAVNEGITHFIAMNVDAKSKGGVAETYNSGYCPLVMLTAQLYCIFGEKVFESYFSHTTFPMAKALDLNKEKFDQFLLSFNDILNFLMCGQFGFVPQHMINDAEIETTKLLERKMLRELAKHNQDFSSPSCMRFAIESAFVDFSKHLYFGYDMTAFDKDWCRIYDQMEKSMQNCFNFGNKLLARRGLPKMQPPSKDIRKKFVDSTHENYLYVGNNTSEITLSDRLVPFERENFAPTEKTIYKDLKSREKFYGRTLKNGDVFLSLANGADLDAWSNFLKGDGVELNKYLQSTKKTR